MPRKPWDREGPREAPAPGVTFELDTFAWSAPDELELTGRFTGLHPAPEDTPALVVHGGGEMRRLGPVPDGLRWPPPDGEPWRAAFGWDEPPTPIDVAELRIGGLVVELPEPGAESASAPQVLSAVEEDLALDGDGTELLTPADRLREQADLVLAQEELRGAVDARDLALEELARVQGQLEDERHARAADAERFRESLDALRTTAEQSIAGERQAAASLRDEVAAAREGLERNTAMAARLEEERDAALARLKPLKDAAREVEDLRARVEESAQWKGDLRSQLGEADRELADLRAACAHVTERLQGIRAITDGS
jgi:hypothetical protein